MKIQTEKRRNQARFLYMALAALFVGALLACNLIANKFVSVDLGFKTFQVSAGVLPYPLTFLITDILSETYGKRATYAVVASGFFASLLVLLVLWLGASFPALENSPVSNVQYAAVFQNSGRIILASMLAYLVAQFVDVRIFHFWKKLTNGKQLWIRNNFSTFLSQFIDTFLVVTVIFYGVEGWDFIGGLVWDSWLFKILFAAADTVVIYLAMYFIQKRFALKTNQEISL